VIGLPTIDMIGYNLVDTFGGLFLSEFHFEENLYPRLKFYLPLMGHTNNHPIDVLSSAPIRLDANDNTHNVRRNF